MSYKPDESTLIGFLYGELDPSEMQQVEAYLSAHPEVGIKLKELEQTRKVLGSLTDKPVETPILLSTVPTATPIQKRWFSGVVRNAAAVTVLVGFLMGMGKFTDADLQIGSSGISLSFGGNSSPNPVSSNVQEVDKEVLLAFLQTTLNASEKVLIDRQEQWQQELAEKLLAKQPVPDAQLMDQLTKRLEDRMNNYFQGAQQENAQVLATYWQEVALTQKNYMNLLLEDYAEGLQRLREEDLLFLQDRLNGLQVKNQQLEQEVSEILIYLLAEMQTPSPSNP